MAAMTVSSPGQASERIVARRGVSQAVLIAAEDAKTAAQRLQTLLARYTGATPDILAPSQPVPAAKLRIVLCTVADRADVQKLLSPWERRVHPKPDGFTLSAPDGEDGHIAVIGGDAAGLRYGVGELWDYHLKLDGQTATVAVPLRLTDAPAFSKRIFWNWDFLTNWSDDLHQVHNTRAIDPGATQTPYAAEPDGFNKQFTKVIDFAADHKLNGLIIWGFVSDQHGGVDEAQRISHYAREQSVRILPGVGTVIYGGFVHSGDSPYSMNTWLKNHPEVMRMVGKDGKPMAAPCPSDPRLLPFLKEGARWFFTTFKDIGGVNLEHGDFFECQCPMCKAERAKPENDHNFFWDMMHTQVPVVKTAHSINPDLWITFSPYEGYNKEMMTNPPHFLKQYPDYAVVQWTYSGMIGAKDGWPKGLKPPPGTHHSIGLVHQGSYWYGPRQWWGSPGQTYALIPDIIQKVCSRAYDDHSEGLENEGQVGPASPQNELNYLAFEEFSWHPKRTLDDWIDTRLPAIYGSVTLARRFYALTADETTAPDVIEAARAEAQSTAKTLTDARQSARWSALATELTRRLALAKAGKTKPYGPSSGSVEDAKDLSVPW